MRPLRLDGMLSKLKNDAYLTVAYPDGNKDNTEVIWLDELEEKFELAEKAKCKK